MSFKFIAMADTSSGTDILDSISKSIISNNLNPNFILFPGDQTISYATQADFDEWKQAMNGYLLGDTNNGLLNKTFATRGNHEGDGPAFNWQTEFNFSSVAANVGAFNYTEYENDMTYSFDYDNCHFIGVDMINGDIALSTSILNWMDTDLTNAENPANNRGIKYTFFFWHGPFYSVDGSCCPPPGLITIMNNHPTVLGGFFGHEHFVTYTHVTNTMPGGPSELIRPFENIITGGAGADLFYSLPGQVDYYLDQEAGSTTFGYVLMSINEDNVDASFYTYNGTLKKTIPIVSTCIAPLCEFQVT